MNDNDNDGPNCDSSSGINGGGDSDNFDSSEELQYSSHSPADRKEFAKQQRRKAYLKAKEYQKKRKEEQKLIPPTEAEIEYKKQLKERAKEARRKSYLQAKARKNSRQESKNSTVSSEDSEPIIPEPFHSTKEAPENRISRDEIIESIGSEKLKLITPVETEDNHDSESISASKEMPDPVSTRPKLTLIQPLD